MLLSLFFFEGGSKSCLHGYSAENRAEKSYYADRDCVNTSARRFLGQPVSSQKYSVSDRNTSCTTVDGHRPSTHGEWSEDAYDISDIARLTIRAAWRGSGQKATPRAAFLLPPSQGKADLLRHMHQHPCSGFSRGRDMLISPHGMACM